MAHIKNPKADLRSKYRKIFEISLIISLALLIAAFKFTPNPNAVEKYQKPDKPWIHISDTQPTTQILKRPKPPKPVIPEIAVEKEQPVDIDFKTTELNEKAPVTKLPPKRNVIISDEPFIEIPDQLPVPVDGMAGIESKITYPQIAKRVGITGRVWVRAYIDKSGKVVKTEIVKGIGGGCDEAAMNAVLKTKFKPGKQRGRPVKVKVVIPIDFRLTN